MRLHAVVLSCQACRQISRKTLLHGLRSLHCTRLLEGHASALPAPHYEKQIGRLSVSETMTQFRIGRSLVALSAAAAAALLLLRDKRSRFLEVFDTVAFGGNRDEHTAITLSAHNSAELGESPSAHDFIEADKVVEGETLFTCGTDRWFRPTLVARPCMHPTCTREESLQAVGRCMETVRHAFDRLPNRGDQILVLYDLGGAGYRNFDITFTRELIQGLLQEFPDRLQRVLVINAHWTVSTAWLTVKRLLHPDTQEKVVFCGSSYQATLLDYIDADHPYLAYLQR